MKNCPKCNTILYQNTSGWKCLVCGLTSESAGFYHAQFDAWIPLRTVPKTSLIAEYTRAVPQKKDTMRGSKLDYRRELACG